MTKKSENKGEIVTSGEEAPVVAFINQAITAGAPIETMERLFALHERWEANQAKKVFNEAMANFKRDCPVITKDKAGGETKSGQRAYNYAPIESIARVADPIMSKYGLSYDWDVTMNRKDNTVKVVCTANHIQGHSKTSTIEVSVGSGTQIMSQPQKEIASVTFAKRYSMVDVFGIIVGGEDNENVLQDAKDFQKDTVKEAIARLQLSKTPEELQQSWSSLPASAKKEPSVIKTKDEMKAGMPQPDLSDEEKQEIIKDEK